MTQPKILVISNGYGEDHIALKIVQALSVDLKQVIAAPLVGKGMAYQSERIDVLCTQSEPPSGGFILTFWDGIKDIIAGAVTNLFRQRRLIRACEASLQIVVGDVYALWMARSNVPTVFLSTAKTERAIPHFWIERWYIKRKAKLVFPRDIDTHDRFFKSGITSQFCGNPMFDGMVSSIRPCESNGLALLPGSRHEMAGNLQRLLAVIAQVTFTKPMVVRLGIASHIDISTVWPTINADGWRLLEASTGQQLVHDATKRTIEVSHQFFDVLQQSTVVLGLAGTANEQAMKAKRHVISFIGTGPQSTKQRFLQQSELIDGAKYTFIDSADPVSIATQVSNYVNSEKLRWVDIATIEQYAARDIASKILN